jgi:hypothetical protein
MRKHHERHRIVQIREKPQGEFRQGEQPRREVTFSIDVKGGEINQMHGETNRGMIPGGAMVTGGA